MPATPSASLAAPLDALRGVGRERAAQLARLALFTVGDLLLHRPRRHEDRRQVVRIAQMRLGEAATVRGRVVALGLKRYRKGTKSVFELIIDDGSARLHCRWWNLPFMEKYFRTGYDVFVFGKPDSLKPRTIEHPETEVVESSEDASLHMNRIVPVYPLTEGLPQRWLRGLIWRTLAACGSQIAEPWWAAVAPPPRAAHGQALAPAAAKLPELPSRANAIRMLHFPAEMADVETARQRLALDEFMELQLGIQGRRKKLQAGARGLPCGGDNRLIKPFLHLLGFQLTAAQTRVLRELRHDMARTVPMRRLLQGDVASGKTVVAACCALMALESGFNVALMAPTEILAEQHRQTFRRWFAPLGIAVELQTGAYKTRMANPKLGVGSGRLPLAALPPEPLTLFIGTHALIEAAFEMRNLGLVIIDEQHKFGVAQREQFLRKGRYPHLLVITATPIPRTLGLTLYGDLDISVIDQPPAGRGRIRTFARGAEQLAKVHAFIRQKITEGRQCYVVCPRVEESDLRTGLKAVRQEFEQAEKIFAPHRVGLLHGRMRPEDKRKVMAAFRANQVQVLLATSIIEVGLDVPNATVMLIENADQFGLAQLHQLRGRIGRGAHESYCILVASAKTEDAMDRLRILTGTNDGFRIAEADLKLRGPGELLGQRQSGLPPLRFGNLSGDITLIEQARDWAATVLRAAAQSPARDGH
jgi:ATP-dependent DNA helicase RecG